MGEEFATEPSLYQEEYQVLGEVDFLTARNKLLAMGIKNERIPSKEALYKLKSTPTYEEMFSLTETLNSDIEIAVLFDCQDWYMARGFASFDGKQNGITIEFLKLVPDQGIGIHTHFKSSNIFANPSVGDVAYAIKQARYLLIGGKGFTEYSGVENIKGVSEDPRLDPSLLIGKFHDEDEYFRASVEQQQEIMTKMGMVKRGIPWGEEAQKYWTEILEIIK